MVLATVWPLRALFVGARGMPEGRLENIDGRVAARCAGVVVGIAIPWTHVTIRYILTHDRPRPPRPRLRALGRPYRRRLPCRCMPRNSCAAAARRLSPELKPTTSANCWSRTKNGRRICRHGGGLMTGRSKRLGERRRRRLDARILRRLFSSWRRNCDLITERPSSLKINDRRPGDRPRLAFRLERVRRR